MLPERESLATFCYYNSFSLVRVEVITKRDLGRPIHPTIV